MRVDAFSHFNKQHTLAIEIFEEELLYALPYKYVVFNATQNVSSSYDDFV